MSGLIKQVTQTKWGEESPSNEGKDTARLLMCPNPRKSISGESLKILNDSKLRISCD